MASCTIPRIHALPLDVPRIFALVSGRKQGRVKRGERASERERRKSGGARRRANAAAHRRRRSQFYRRGAIGGSHGPWYLGIARARELDGLPVVGTFVPRRRPALVACARAYLAYAHTPTHVRTHARDGVHEEEAGREEPEDAPRTGLAAGQQGMLRLQPARADLRQHDDRLVRLHLLLWYAVSSSGSKLFACSSSPLPRRPSPWQFPGSRVNRSVICHSRAPPAT